MQQMFTMQRPAESKTNATSLGKAEISYISEGQMSQMGVH